MHRKGGVKNLRREPILSHPLCPLWTWCELLLERVIERSTKIEIFERGDKRRVIRCIDDPLITQKIDNPATLDHVGNLWVASQRDDPRVIAQLARAGK